MKKRLIKFFAILLIIPTLFLSIKYVKADSGWDTDYDSGGSWDNGSSWNSSSHSRNYSSSRSSIDPETANAIGIILAIVFLIGWTYFMIIASKWNKEKLKHSISKEIAQSIIPNFDIKEFEKLSYKMFYDIQIAWMNFDYDKLKDLLTDELYNTYMMDLDVLKSKKQQNVMKKFELKHSAIFDLVEENGKYIAKVELKVKFYDYIKSINTNKILRGTNSRKVNNTYILTFIKSKGDNNNVKICPECRASVEGNQTGICEYCKSKLINEEFDWVLSNKEKISQR